MLLLLACAGPPAVDSKPPHPRPPLDSASDTAPDDSGPDDTGPPAAAPIFLFWTVDTLGAVAAGATGFCDAVSEVAAAHGLDAACLSRGIAPASWTGESHTRVLWPENLTGGGATRSWPGCDQVSVLSTLAEATGSLYLFGADNSLFTSSTDAVLCEDGLLPWGQGTDRYFEYTNELEVELIPEEDRPAHEAITSLLANTARGAGVVVYLNSFEAGGHKPRCWFAPDTPACVTLYQLALDLGVVSPEDDPAKMWTVNDVITAIAQESQVRWASDPETLRSLWWETITTQAEHFRPTFVTDRLDRILVGLERQGRLDDVRMVIVGDHGENTGTPNVLTGEIQLWHSDLPTEHTAEVPVVTIPATFGDDLRARGFAGDGTEVWSTANLAWGVLDAYEVPVPDTWPTMEPVGAASSWVCTAHPAGVRIAGDASVRCQDGVCGAWSWTVPEAVTDDPVPLEAVPSDLAPWASPEGGAPWFDPACTLATATDG